VAATPVWVEGASRSSDHHHQVAQPDSKPLLTRASMPTAGSAERCFATNERSGRQPVGSAEMARKQLRKSEPANATSRSSPANVRAYASTPTALTTRCAESSPRGAASEIVVALATDEFPKSAESIAACHPSRKGRSAWPRSC
jgi:hypothetical protein